MSELKSWLNSIGLGRYEGIFSENEIDFDVLADLSEQDLEKLGIPMGPRKRLLKHIAALEHHPVAAPLRPSESTAPRTYTPSHLAERILQARSALEGERKQVTILFADIKGSTELVEHLDPEEANRLLSPALQKMMDAVHRYEGTVNRVQGDGLMAMFGAPLAHEDHAMRACYAALAMQKAVRAQAEGHSDVSLEIRVGLHSGEVVVRAINNDLSMNYDAVGITAHLAARMEQLAAPDSICLTAETLRLAEGLIEFEVLGPRPVKGIAEPVAMYRLCGATGARTRWQAALKRGLSRFVGRKTVLHTLTQVLEQASAGQGQVAAIVGEAGVGKSRLVYEFLRSPAAGDWQMLAGSSVSYGKASNWLPVIDLLKDYFGLEDDDAPELQATWIRSRLAQLDTELTANAVAFLALLELPVDDPAWQGLGAMQQRRRTLEALKVLFMRESERRALIVVFEDLHWIDGETQVLLDELVDLLPGSRMLLLVDYRPEYTHAWNNRSYYLQLRLDPLGQASAEQLLSALLGDDPGLAELKRTLLARSAGNPLFLEESARALVETGTLVGEAGAYRLAKSPDPRLLPATLQALIAERIDRLAPAHKRLLQSASVIGTNLPLQLLQAVARQPEDELQRGLHALQAAEFFYPGQLFPEPEYRFKHAHTHQVAYAGMLTEQRREMHVQVAETLQRLYPKRRMELAEKLAEHYEQGERWQEAAEHCLSAAVKGKEKYTYPSASRYAERALALAEKRPGVEQQVEALTLLGDLASLLGDLDASNEHYERALARVDEPSRHRAIANRVHRRRFAERNGANIAYYEHGSGDETLLFVVPTTYRVALFQPIIETLCQEFRAVTLDPRGTGASDPVPDHYPQYQYVEDIRAVIEALDCGPVIGVGISQSGNQMTKLTWAYPRLIAKLVLVSTSPNIEFFQRTEEQRRWDEMIRRGDFGEVEAWCTDFGYALFPESEARDLAEEWIRRTLQLPREALCNFLKGDEDPELDITSLLADIGVPTLVIQGTADRDTPFAAASYLTEHLPDARLHAFEGKGHQPMYTATKEFCEVLREFVRAGAVRQHG